MKRTIQELTDYKDVFFSLIDIIRQGQAEKLEEVTALIRNRNGSIEDIAHLLGHQGTQFSDPRTLSTASHLSLSEDGDHEQQMMEPLDIPGRRASKPDMFSTSPEEPQHLESPKAAFNPYARVTLESLCDIRSVQSARKAVDRCHGRRRPGVPSCFFIFHMGSSMHSVS